MIGIERFQFGEDFSFPKPILKILIALREVLYMLVKYTVMVLNQGLNYWTVAILVILLCMFIVYYVCVHMLPNDFPFFIQSIATSIISNIVPFSWFWGDFAAFDNFCQESASQKSSDAASYFIGIMTAPLQPIYNSLKRNIPSMDGFIVKAQHDAFKNAREEYALKPFVEHYRDACEDRDKIEALREDNGLMYIIKKNELLNCSLDAIKAKMALSQNINLQPDFDSCDNAVYPEVEKKLSPNGVPYEKKQSILDIQNEKINCKLQAIQKILV